MEYLKPSNMSAIIYDGDEFYCFSHLVASPLWNSFIIALEVCSVVSNYNIWYEDVFFLDMNFVL